MKVVDLRTYRDPSFTPLVILVDLQREYLGDSGALALEDPDQALHNCHLILQFARELRLPVAFLRWVQHGKFFRRSAEATGWIEGLEPRGNEMVFERDYPSAYANGDFLNMMDGGGGDNAIVAGFTGTIACLATVIDAFHRQHSITFIEDASASHSTCSMSSFEAHRSAVDIAQLYCPVETTNTWLKHAGRETGESA